MNSAGEDHFVPSMTRAQNLLKKIKELEEICAKSLPILSTEIPSGYTQSRWDLSLQSFNERLPLFKNRNFFRNSPVPDESDLTFEIEMGPEWELKCARRELEELLNSY